MSDILDYVASVLMGGMLMVNILSANDIAGETYAVYQGDMTVQETLITTVQFVEGEFRNMGFGVPENERTVLYADTSVVRFLMDIDRDGAHMDTVTYWLGTTSDLSETQNENDRFLYRRVNHGSVERSGVVTMFSLRYLTRNGETMGTPVASDRLSEIHEVEITMEVQNSYAPYASSGGATHTALYSNSYWQQTRLASQNSRR
jgi:hypothetical protein